MTTCGVLLRSFCLVTVFCLFAPRQVAAQIAGVAPAPNPRNGYRIAGTVVSKLDGHPLARCRVTVGDTKHPQKVQSAITSDDGKFEFLDMAAGKYSLTGAKRGFISASYDQHDQFSTAVVTGAGLDTEAFVLRLAPAAVITGKVLDEAGEPVRQATVMVYYDDHSAGVDQIRPWRGAQTDDQGAYEITPLIPGTYFLSAGAKPWYAVHPNAETEEQAAVSVDRSLDVAYPTTYYADATEPDSATPIPIRGGERIDVDLHLTPVPSLRLKFRVPGNGKNGFAFPQLQQPAFDGATFVQNTGVRQLSPGVMEITGIPAGRYNVRIDGDGTPLQINGVDLNKDGQEIDGSGGEALGSVKVSVQVLGEATIPPQLVVALRTGIRSVAGWHPLAPNGVAEIQGISAGRYTVLVDGSTKRYFIAHISAEGAEVSGRTLIMPPGASASVALTLVGGGSEIQGTVKRAGKACAGAMVVLVPKGPEMDRDLFRRDQSDQDGTFSLRDVVPGSYTVVAIDDGWDLDWSQPAVIAVYLKRGREIDVGSQGQRPVVLDAIEVQNK